MRVLQMALRPRLQQLVNDSDMLVFILYGITVFGICRERIPLAGDLVQEEIPTDREREL